MGTSLNGLTPQNTYQGLLKFGDNSALDGTLKTLSDGSGNDTLISLSTTSVNIGANNLVSILGIKGSGSTSATTSMLVQNSSSTELFKVADNGGVTMGVSGASHQMNGVFNFNQNVSFKAVNDSGSSALNLRFVVSGALRSFLINADYNNSNSPSALLEIQSTTKGFLPPKMTTTQKLAIATPASGLQVYDTTLNKMSYYNGTTWVNF